MEVLRINSKGPSVGKLQILLNEKLMLQPKLVVDCEFGPATLSAVKKFQQQFKLTADGVVGPQTWSCLLSASNLPPGQHRPPAAPANRSNPRSNHATPGAPWMQTAWAEEGVAEMPGRAKNNARIIEYFTATTLRTSVDETPWCSAFVNWVLTQHRIQGSKSAAAASWLSWGKELSQPKAGAIVVIRQKSFSGANSLTASGYHVAFLLSKSPSMIELLGGNQRDKVKVSNFPLSAYEVKSYRWPS